MVCQIRQRIYANTTNWFTNGYRSFIQAEVQARVNEIWYTIFGYYSILLKCICAFTKADPGIGILYSGIIVYYRHAYARFKIWPVKQMRMCAGWGWGGCNYGRRVLQLKCLHHHVPHPHVIQSVILMLLISDYYCHAALRPTFFCPFFSLSYFIRPHIARPNTISHANCQDSTALSLALKHVG